MELSTKLIICINSLHYLNNNRFDIVVYDESDTTLNKWFDNKPWVKLDKKDIKKVYDDLEDGKIKNKNGEIKCL